MEIDSDRYGERKWTEWGRRKTFKNKKRNGNEVRRLQDLKEAFNHDVTHRIYKTSPVISLGAAESRLTAHSCALSMSGIKADILCQCQGQPAGTPRSGLTAL